VAGVSAPAHVLVTTYVEAQAVIQYVDRGLLVHQRDDEFIIREVRITYRWVEIEQRWEFKTAVGYGARKMPGTGYPGPVVKEVTAIHPDYRRLAQLHAPRWRPPKVERNTGR
jgi:hypothetical protein